MNYIQGDSRDQLTLFPESLDEFVAEDHPARFLDAFVDNLDLASLGFKRSKPGDMGRPSYDPADLLKLFLYGYFYKVRSSRRLARETHRNIEVMWLIKRLNPDFRTVSDFRKDNKKAIQKVSGEFTVFCHRIGLIAGELVAIDGSKFRGVNAEHRNFTRSRVKMLLKQADNSIQEYMKQLDVEDVEEADQGTFLVEDAESKRQMLKELMEEEKARTKEKLKKALEKKAKLEDLEQELKSKSDPQVSLTDPDARKMKTRNGALVGYNVQAAVDEKNKMIVAMDVVQERCDVNQLCSMIKKTKEITGSKELIAVADKGYFKEEEIHKSTELATVYVPELKRPNPTPGFFPKSDFKYDPGQDTYICPAGEIMTKRVTKKKCGTRLYRTHHCQGCSMKSQCTPNQRSIRRTKYADSVDAMRERSKTKPDMMKKRRAMAEHPFGVLKHSLGLRYFLTKGIDSVKAEMSLGVFTFNLKRAINILGTQRMIEAIS